jgi:hypothetical protein
MAEPIPGAGNLQRTYELDLASDLTGVDVLVDKESFTKAKRTPLSSLLGALQHNDTGGKQGGIVGEYFHLSEVAAGIAENIPVDNQRILFGNASTVVNDANLLFDSASNTLTTDLLILDKTAEPSLSFKEGASNRGLINIDASDNFRFTNSVSARTLGLEANSDLFYIDPNTFFYDESETEFRIKDTISVYDGANYKSTLVQDSVNGFSLTGKDSADLTKVSINAESDSYFNGGNFGIGTETPDSLLHLYQGGLTFESQNSTTNKSIIFQNSAGAERFYINYDNSAPILSINYTTISNLLTFAASGQVGIGKTPIDGVLDINLTTEDFAVVDAGSTGATAQDWIEVKIGGNTGYIRVYATK